MDIPTINTANLTLRAFSENDGDKMHQILMGKNVLRYFPSSSPPSREQVTKMINNLLKHWDDYGYGLWAIESGLNGELMGRSGLQYLPVTDEVEVDFILGRNYWGQGFATEAGKAGLQYGFDELGFNTVVGIVHTENAASQRVLEKIGMRFTEAKEYFGMACYRYAIEKEMVE